LILFKLLVCAVERAWPRHPFRAGIQRRWIGNAGLFAVGLVSVGWMVLPGGPIGVAFYCSQHGFGLLRQVTAHRLIEGIAGFLVIDFFMWLQHWVQHRVGLLWRSHRVHHTDLDLDFSTALRFHPFEALFAIGVRALMVALFGVSIFGALFYEIALDVSSTLVHSNLRVPPRADAVLRRIFVTPEVHRVHHVSGPSMERNYATILSVWDRLFHTYQAPSPPGTSLELGLPGHRDAAALGVFALLLLPFRANPPRERRGPPGSAR